MGCDGLCLTLGNFSLLLFMVLAAFVVAPVCFKKCQFSLLSPMFHSKCGYDEAKEKTNEDVLGEEKEHQLDGLKCAKELNRLLHLGFVHTHLLVSCTK